MQWYKFSTYFQGRIWEVGCEKYVTAFLYQKIEVDELVYTNEYFIEHITSEKSLLKHIYYPHNFAAFKRNRTT